MDSATRNTLMPPCEASVVENGWGAIPLVLPPALPLALFVGLSVKRLLDIVGATLGLVLLSPVLLVIGVLIRIDSKGPALFRQRRIGRYGQMFSILKFRTMTSDAEAHLRELEALNESAHGVLFKMKHDPRVTPIGHFLRRTNLDELPQLINVLKGEMSLVGPRPFQMRDSEKLRKLDPQGFNRRLDFPPGLTGNWQVRRSSPVDSDHLLDFDLEYVDNWSLSRDLFLLYRTFFIVIAGFRCQD
jgi:lipopolysaccharide/colanic/teichoic acid biosynthesis glycosyltransferase